MKTASPVPSSPPIAFVTGSRRSRRTSATRTDSPTATAAAVSSPASALTVTNAIGGLLGTGLAVFIALRSGSAEGYFVPRMLYAAALALVFAGSVVIRKPIVEILVVAVYRAPKEWMEDPRVRRAFSEITLAWGGLFAFRAGVYAVLIAAGKAGWLAFASVAMGWPAFLALLFVSYRYVPWRLARLGAPPRPDA